MSQPLYTPWTPDQPMVTVAITEPDVMSVAAFGIPYKLPAEYYPLSRHSFGQVMDHLWSRLQEPFTVEILDTDGSRTTGTIDLRPPTPPEVTTGWGAGDTGASPRRMAADSVYDPADDAGRQAETVATPDQTAETLVGGFLPGEHVAVTVVVGVAVADADGQVGVTVPTWMCQEMLLLGRESGQIGHPRPGMLGR